MLAGVIESFIGTFLALALFLIPLLYIGKKKLENFNPMGSMLGEFDE